MMRSAMLRLPSHMRRPTRRVTLRLLYLGSGSTARCGTVPRRGIGSLLLLITSIAPDSAKGAEALAPAPHRRVSFRVGLSERSIRLRRDVLARSHHHPPLENARQRRRGCPRGRGITPTWLIVTTDARDELVSARRD